MVGRVFLGLTQGAYELARGYAGARRRFGGPSALPGHPLEAIKLDAARLLIHRAAANTDTGCPDVLEATKAKTFAAEIAQEVTGQALQIHGAAGYGRALPLERMVRDARMFAIGGGTVEMMRNLIADRLLPTRADFRR